MRSFTFVVCGLMMCLSASVARAEVPAAEQVERPAVPRNGATAYAAPLRGMEIDGKLQDWPKDTPRYPVLNNFEPYGTTDLDERNLLDNEDCRAEFMVGYSADRGVVYVAVIVRDEEHVLGNRFDLTDAVEIYVEGAHRRTTEEMGVPGVAAMQFGAVAGEASYNGDGVNPAVVGLRGAHGTKSEFGYDRGARETVYEFAVEPFDHFPDQPTTLQPGKRIGWDVAVLDKDSGSMAPSMVFWGPIGALKFYNAALLGDLVLLGSVEELRATSGRMLRADGRPWAGLDVEVFSGGEPAGAARTDHEGRFAMRLPKGEYTLKAARGQGVLIDPVARFKVAGDAVTIPDAKAAPMPVPDALRRAAEAYRALPRYADRVTVERKWDKDGEIKREWKAEVTFVAARPDRVRLTCVEPQQTAIELRADGRRVAAFRDGEPFGEPIAIEGGVPNWALRRAFLGPRAYHNMQWIAVSLLVHRLALADDPLRDLLRGADKVEDRGDVNLAGEPCRLVEITKPASFALRGSIFYGSLRDRPMMERLWISQETGLIRRVVLQYTPDEFMASPLEPGLGQYPFTGTIETLTARHEVVEVKEDEADERFRLPEPVDRE